MNKISTLKWADGGGFTIIGRAARLLAAAARKGLRALPDRGPFIARAALVLSSLFFYDAGPVQAASTVPFDDNFDSGYSNGQAVDGGVKGWGTTSNCVVATNADYQSASFSAFKPFLETLSNTFSSSFATNVWVDSWLKESDHIPASAVIAVNTNDAVNLYMNTDTNLVVYDSSVAAWRICTTDFMNNASSSFSAGGWAHVTVNINYGTKQAAIFLNGHSVAQQVPLINTNTLSALSKVALEGGRFNGAVYWDGVWVSTNWPQATWVTNDLDADGMADAQEIHLYGNTTRYVGTRFVPSTAYPTIFNALALAVEGEHVVVSNAAYAESAVVSNGVTLTGTNLTGTATNWTMSGAVEVLSGGSVLVSGGEAVFANLTIDAGGTVVVSNATVTVNGVTRSGTFTMSSDWQTVVPRAVSFTETFDGFGVGTMLGGLASLGWSVSANSVQIQAGGASGNGVQCPVVEKATNYVSATSGAKLWTDVYVNDTNTIANPSLVPVDPNQTVTLCVGTNGYVLLYSGGGWLTCSSDVVGGNVDGLWSNGFNRISIFQDYGEHKAAVFLNGRLLKQNLPFINTNTNQMHWVDIEAGVRGDTWFDTLSVTNGVPAGLETGPFSDLDHNAGPDALEIQRYGTLVSFMPRGSVFKIR